MIRSMLAAGALCLSIGADEACAEVLTCTVFKTRFDQALQVVAPKGKPSVNFSPASVGGVATPRYAWTGVTGLEGRLTCAKDDAFADFYMALTPAARAASETEPDLTQFSTIGAASICALATGSPEACKNMMSTMVKDGLEQYADDIAQHDDRPQSLQDYDFAEGLDAVFLMSPRTVSWAIGPGAFNAVEATRTALDPRDRELEDDDDDDD